MQHDLAVGVDNVSVADSQNRSSIGRVFQCLDLAVKAIRVKQIVSAHHFYVFARGQRQRLVPISGDSKIGLVFHQSNSSVAELFYDRNRPVS